MATEPRDRSGRNPEGGSTSEEGARPNIIFVLADDLGYFDLGCYGQRNIGTPNIDRMAAEGTRFTDCYAGSAVCAPSRSVLMTGQHTGHTRIRGNFAQKGGVMVLDDGPPQRREYLRGEDITVAEVLKGAGTKYTPSPTLVGVASAVQEHDLKEIAVVGTPCQMRALRKIETGARCEAKISDAVRLKIGLFCMETFAYPSLMEYLENEGIDASNVGKFEIKGGRFIANQDGEIVHRARLSKVKHLVRGCCHGCGDFTAEFSDISAGNVGSPDGWSTVIVRTEVGEKALKAAEKAGLVEVQPVEEGKSGLGLVERLAVKKREDAEKSEEE